MKGLILVVLVVLVGYLFIEGIEMFKTNSDFGDRVEHQINFVSEETTNGVRQDLVADAQKLGVNLTPENIQITYEDSEQRTLAQNIVGGKLGTQFVNKRVTIEANYVQRILGIPFHQRVVRTGIRQVQAPRQEPSSEMKSLLDATPQ